MPDTSRKLLQQEWHSLHNNVEQSEGRALLIKLLAVVLCLLGLLFGLNVHLLALLLMVLWLQEAIWKTFQGRIESRLLALERTWSGDDEAAMVLSFYTRWMADRPGPKGLLIEYLSSMARPTVAYPYLPLILVAYISTLF